MDFQLGQNSGLTGEANAQVVEDDKMAAEKEEPSIPDLSDYMKQIQDDIQELNNQINQTAKPADAPLERDK